MLGLVCPRIVGQRFGCRCLSQFQKLRGSSFAVSAVLKPSETPHGRYLKRRFHLIQGQKRAGRDARNHIRLILWLGSHTFKTEPPGQGFKHLVCDPAHHCLLTDCSISANDQRVINAFKLSLRPLGAFLVGSQLDGIPTIDISELRRQLLTDGGWRGSEISALQPFGLFIGVGVVVA